MRRKVFFLTTAAILTAGPCFFPVSAHWAPGVAVIAGVLFAVTLGNPFAGATGKLTSQLLAAAIVLMGFGMNLGAVLRAGAGGIFYTLSGIVLGIGGALWLGKKLKLGRDATWLIGVGTSICGGSAIAAAAPALKAREHDIAIASATVFTLNAAALLLFPAVGHRLGMSETQVGFWSALAI
ncbi:MAG: putative sulfate exporter family transporter, partial [Victivallaceae bacterium]